MTHPSAMAGAGKRLSMGTAGLAAAKGAAIPKMEKITNAAAMDAATPSFAIMDFICIAVGDITRPSLCEEGAGLPHFRGDIDAMDALGHAFVTAEAGRGRRGGRKLLVGREGKL